MPRSRECHYFFDFSSDECYSLSEGEEDLLERAIEFVPNLCQVGVKTDCTQVKQIKTNKNCKLLKVQGLCHKIL